MNHDMLDSLAETLVQFFVMLLPFALVVGAAIGWRKYRSGVDAFVGALCGTIVLLILKIAILLSVAFVEGWLWAFRSIFGGGD